MLNVYAASPVDRIPDGLRDALEEQIVEWLANEYPPDGVNIHFPLGAQKRQSASIKKHGPVAVEAIRRTNIRKLHECDVLVVFHPGLSKGAHFEIGYVAALNANVGMRQRQVEIRVVEFEDIEQGSSSLMVSNYEVEKVPCLNSSSSES